ncbi:MAG: hypothetical protein WC467_02065 [Patescibacteria group bacterium]
MHMLKIMAAALRRRSKITIVAGVALVVFPILLYLFIALMRVSPAELALKRLEESYRLMPICHEQCALERDTWEKSVVNELKRNKKRVLERLKIEWRNKNAGDAFKAELVHIIYLAYGPDNPPEYLLDYLSEPNAKPQIIREIIMRFNSVAFARYDLEEILTRQINQATSSADKLEAIKTLGEIKNDAEISNYFAILDSDTETEMRREAIKNISAIRQKSSFFTIEQLNIIKKIVLAPETDNYLRQDLIFLLGDYYLVYPAESLEIWQEVYKDTALDSLSRAFSADYLNHLDTKKVELPEVSAADWDSYYNQNISN